MRLSDRTRWTFVELRPNGYDRLVSPYASRPVPAFWQPVTMPEVENPKKDMLYPLLYSVHAMIRAVIQNWDETLTYMDNLIGGKNSFLDPAYHDTLVSDDANFSSTKKYFWVISAIREMRPGMKEAILQVDTLLTKTRRDMDKCRGLEPQIRELRDDLVRAQEALIELRRRLDSIHDDASFLRNGVSLYCDVMTQNEAKRRH